MEEETENQYWGGFGYHFRMYTSLSESESENLYRVTMQGKWEEVVKIYEKNPKAHKMRITHEGGTALHLAVIECKEDAVFKLVQEISKIDKSALEIQNDRGDTPLHHAASAGCKIMCKYIVKAANPRLIGVRTNNGETALFISAINGNREAFFYLHSVCFAISVSNLSDCDLYSYTRRSNNGDNILHAAINNGHFDLAYQIIHLYGDLVTSVNENGLTPFNCLAKPDAFKSPSYNLSLWKRLIYQCIVVKELKEDPISNLQSEGRKNLFQNSIRIQGPRSQSSISSNEMQGIFPTSYDKFLKVLATLGVEKIPPQETAEIDGPEKIPPQETAEIDGVVIMAARYGVVEIVKKFLDNFPATVHDRDQKMKNILILAAENRHPNVYNLLIKKHILSNTTFLKADSEENNVLHAAAKYNKNRPWPIPGVALQMQWEIKWFEFVKASMPPGITFRPNRDKMTPEEVFSKTHQELIEKGRDWLIKTSESCSVVAALIAGVAFATIASVPGGTLDTSGKPIFEKQPAFQVFSISSLIALCFAFTALVMFLAIITSRFQEKDFTRSLPLKLLLGLSSLFVSIGATLVCFCTGHFFMIGDRLKNAAYPVYALTCFPASIFAAAQFPLYIDLFLSIFRNPFKHHRRYRV
ncbi:hypothetical protein FEM48_Zijuj09G0043700 [Ziziphus jujuba var. spinosa]|uniref:PGG domain-containing protein n=1 Tax=Ziziphus jujuba var. spinosa TaxID=714518 RepID=A0A978UQV6_ZIZJJ|nr:hypothetical protein FEM48_Zijuj09G0043700 [Ziziphus jujuba var. spinosa]